MFSNERDRSSYGSKIYGYTPKPPVAEDVLRTEKIQVERKTRKSIKLITKYMITEIVSQMI